jgi:hypothetical protein
MPALTRKRVNDRPERWHIHYAGVRVGMIVERSGVANTAEPWEWHCGFYPGKQSRRAAIRTGRQFRGSADRVRGSMARVFAPTQRSRLSGLARSGGMDRAQMRNVGGRRADVVADAELVDEMPVRRDVR